MDNIPVAINLEICPVTAFPEQDLEKGKMIRELGNCFLIEVVKVWKINSTMVKHCNEFNTILLVEVSNFNENITPENAERTRRVLSITEEQFNDFFVDSYEFVQGEYLFVKPSVFQAIKQKYFK